MNNQFFPFVFSDVPKITVDRQNRHHKKRQIDQIDPNVRKIIDKNEVQILSDRLMSARLDDIGLLKHKGWNQAQQSGVIDRSQGTHTQNTTNDLSGQSQTDAVLRPQPFLVTRLIMGWNPIF